MTRVGSQKSFFRPAPFFKKQTRLTACRGARGWNSPLKWYEQARIDPHRQSKKVFSPSLFFKKGWREVKGGGAPLARGLRRTVE